MEVKQGAKVTKGIIFATTPWCLACEAMPSNLARSTMSIRILFSFANSIISLALGSLRSLSK